MSETRISRDEIKGIAQDRKNERADNNDINESNPCDSCDCKDGACKWRDEH